MAVFRFVCLCLSYLSLCVFVYFVWGLFFLFWDGKW